MWFQSPLNAYTIPAGTGPLVLYTDIVDGPISGGENNKGTYLSVFFVVPGGYSGTFSDWGSGSHLTIGGVEVDNYRCLQKAVGNSIYGSGNVGEGVGELWGIYRICAQVGALGSPTIGTALPVKITLAGISPLNTVDGSGFLLDLDANRLQFTPVNGRILFVSTTGTDQASYGTNPLAGEGTFAAPLRHLQVYNGTAFNGAIWGAVSGVTTSNAVGPGTHVVLRGGDYSSDATGNFNTSWCDFFRRTGNPASNASQSGNIVITSYPGASGANTPDSVTFKSPAGQAGGFNYADTARSNESTPWGESGYSHYITVANMLIWGPSSTFSTAGAAGSPIDWQSNAKGCRAVNCDLQFAPTSGSPTSGGVSGYGNNSARLGLFIHDIKDPSGNLQNHGFYIGDNPSSNVQGEVQSVNAYNFMIRCHGGQGIMVRGCAQTETVPYISIHHNWFQEIGKFGILWGVSGDGIARAHGFGHHNVIIGAAFTDSGTTGTQAGLAVGSDTMTAVDGFYNGFNTVIGSFNHYAMLAMFGNANTGSACFEGNIFRQNSGTGAPPFGSWFTFNSSGQTIDLQGNDWFDGSGNSSNPSDSGGLFVDPKLVSTSAPFDVHPSVTSTMPNQHNAPAKNPQPIPAYDFFFRTRPQGLNAKWSMGAVERVGG